MTATRVTVHHEGAGTPTDNVARFAGGGYSCGIGITLWQRFRSPNDSWGTLGFNHGPSVDLCLSGNRMTAEVTDNDIALIHAAYLDFRQRGEVVELPEVVAHRNSPGSSTVCPGDRTMLKWPAIVNACRPKPIPPPPKPEVIRVKPQYDPPRDTAPWVSSLANYVDKNGGGWLLFQDGAISPVFGAPPLRGTNGQAFFAGRKAAQLVKPGTKVAGSNPPGAHEDQGIAVVVATSGERYTVGA